MSRFMVQDDGVRDIVAVYEHEGRPYIVTLHWIADAAYVSRRGRKGKSVQAALAAFDAGDKDAVFKPLDGLPRGVGWFDADKRATVGRRLEEARGFDTPDRITYRCERRRDVTRYSALYIAWCGDEPCAVWADWARWFVDAGYEIRVSGGRSNPRWAVFDKDGRIVAYILGVLLQGDFKEEEGDIRVR